MKVLLCMIFLHLIDDYKIQGWLASAKCKDWWKQNVPDEKYKNDYIIALIEHSFMNSFMIHIPIYIWLCKNEFVLAFTVLLSTISHYVVDNAKANHKKINLIQDQAVHLVWIVVIWLGYILL